MAEELCTPVMKEISWLILEQSASHVVRSMLSLLAGIPTIAERKGKNSKHQHSISLAEPLDTLLEAGLFYVSSKATYAVPSRFHGKDSVVGTRGSGMSDAQCHTAVFHSAGILVSSVDILLKLSTKELERLIADFSSSAVLGLLIRILSNPALLQNGANGPQLAQQLFCAALGWTACPAQPSPEAVPAGVQDVFYAMAGDRAGSYFLEALIECSGTDFLLSVVSSSILGKCREYVEDGSGNFVLQAILRRLSCELGRLDPASKSSSGSTGKLLVSVAQSMTNELVGADNFVHVVNLKGGVVLWLLAVANALPGDSAAAERVGVAVQDAWVQGAREAEEGSVVRTLLAAVPAPPSTASATEAELHRQQLLSAVFSSKLLPSLKGDKASEGDAAAAGAQGHKGGNGKGKGKGPAAAPPADPRDTTQLLVARIIGALLKSKAQSVSQITARAFAHLTPEALRYVATSGAVSRAALDVFFEVTAQSTEFKLMGAALASIGAELAQHYVGQHIVRQSFESADLRGKEKWALTLSGSSAQLSRSKEGTASLRLVNAELYQRDPAEWRSAVKRKLKAESLLKELETPAAAAAVPLPKPTGKGHGQGHGQGKRAREESSGRGEAAVEGGDDSGDEEEGAGAEGEGGAAGAGKRKRKRKRPTKAAAGAGGAATAV